MKKLLREAGFSEEDLKDRNTYKVVCHIIDRFGGLETIQKEMGSKGRQRVIKLCSYKYQVKLMSMSH